MNLSRIALALAGAAGLGLAACHGSSTPTDAQLTETVLRWLDMLGLDPAEASAHLVVTPACGLAGATPAWARSALSLLTATAGHL